MNQLCISFIKKTLKSLFLLLLCSYLYSCNGFIRPVDARKVSPNSDERVKQNQKEGKGISFGNILKKSGGGDFQFASSNEMWRASIDILDFVPLTNVDYGGGIIVTDWYSDSKTDSESIKIVIQFLSNEIKSDALKVKIYKKECLLENNNNCQTQLLKTELNTEIKLAILKKASLLKKENKKKK